MIESGRELHRAEVEGWLWRRFGGGEWVLTLPRGRGHETYQAVGGGLRSGVFVKLGSDVERVAAMGDSGLGPVVLDAGVMGDGMSIVVQEWVEGRHPDRVDYYERLEDVARIVGEMHRNEGVRSRLSIVGSDGFAEAGLSAVRRVRERWEGVKGLVDGGVRFVDEGLDVLEWRMGRLRGGGLAASHGDFCRDNLLFAEDGRISVLDLDSMRLDDPALDVGVTLWWYYSPEVWGRFIGYAGYEDDREFRERMWARIALHCLSIRLPRPGSFDRFDGEGFRGALGDFRAALAGEGNPEM